MWQLVLVSLLLALRAPAAEVLQLDIDNVVHPVTVEMVADAIQQTRARGSAVLLVRLNTPGGLMSASREVVEALIASPTPVVTWVGPSGARAASAGFFLLLAGDVAAMAPGTNTGAASPVMLGRELDPVLRRKIESDAGAWLRSIASRRSRNAALAEKTISEAKSFTEQEALESNLINLIAKDQKDLLGQLDGKVITRFDGTQRTLSLGDAKILVYQLSLRQKLLRAVSDPNIALIVLLLGALGLYVEFSMPGLVLPGVVGAILLLVGLTAMALLPLNWLGLALIALALALIRARSEIYFLRDSRGGWRSGYDSGRASACGRSSGVPDQAGNCDRHCAAVRCDLRIPDDACDSRAWTKGGHRHRRACRRNRDRANSSQPEREDICSRRILGRGQFDCC